MVIGAKVDPVAIFERDDRRCHLCGFKGSVGGPQTDRWGLTLDHVVPVSRGGAHNPDNLRAAHRWCNARKGAREVPDLTYHDDVFAALAPGVPHACPLTVGAA